MRRCALLISLTIATLAIPWTTSADIIPTFAGFSINGTNVSQIGSVLQPFNPALGQLDEVFVGISGSLVIMTTTEVRPLPQGGFDPYPYRIQVTNDFFSLLGNLFNFAPEARFIFAGVATGTGETLVQTRNFTYGFTLTDLTDLIGFAPVASSGVDVPPLAVAARSDFLPTPANQYVIEAQFTSSFLLGTPRPVNLAGGGLIEVTYNYTPTPASVPEPSSLLLLGTSGLVLLARTTRRRN